MRQLISSDEAVQAEEQHEEPCSDCPFARAALKGWLGNMTVDQWLMAAHTETEVECHALLGAQCAGLARYRSNVAKLVMSPEILKLPADREKCFATPMEFRAHHEGEPFA